jgi:hypothetical protein
MIVGVKNLCSPAHFYLVVSMIAFVIMAIQNANNSYIYCVGSYTCNTTSVFSIFILKFIYIIFWTWILNIICKSGYTTVSWALVLIPYILFFILVALQFTNTFDSSRYTADPMNAISTATRY